MLKALYLWMGLLMLLSGWFPALFQQSVFHEAWGMALVLALPAVPGLIAAFLFAALSATLLNMAATPGLIVLSILWLLRHRLEQQLMFSHPLTNAAFALVGVLLLLLIDTLLEVSQLSYKLPDYSVLSLAMIVLTVPFWCWMLHPRQRQG